MIKNVIRNVVIHEPDNRDIQALANKISELHVDIIEGRLNRSNLTTNQKITVIDKIIADLKSREVNGIIKSK